ncbi:Acg family FMN-binding oxidoreductase [Streptomyces sp. NPDC051018]|uniref:Acg family FMN-binding oxidoreductase n=1 Tax=Streptomyces sp. NPDC051018 TaxID=3365639 RepID=UPI0037B769A5
MTRPTSHKEAMALVHPSDTTPAAPDAPRAPAPDRATVASLVEDATLAPSMHNAQPWAFTFDPRTRTFRVRVDPAREMPLADPDRRALHLGCAAAVFNLRVAAVHAGWEPVIRLLPDPTAPELLAEVELARPRDTYDELDDLYPALHRRHTNRAPFREERIEEPLLDVLRRAALLEGARLAFPDDFHRRTILELGNEAGTREFHDRAHREETARWTRHRTDAPADGGAGHESPGEPADDGVPGYAFGPRPRTGGAPMRDFGEPEGSAAHGPADFEQAPQLALLGTSHDRPLDWLRAGQAMERVLLEATLDGLSTSVASQALEWSDLRWAVRDPASAMGHVHMVIRLGYGPEGPLTRRRPVDDVLSIDSYDE